jgi:hypothetical protein
MALVQKVLGWSSNSLEPRKENLQLKASCSVSALRGAVLSEEGRARGEGARLENRPSTHGFNE